MGRFPYRGGAIPFRAPDTQMTLGWAMQAPTRLIGEPAPYTHARRGHTRPVARRASGARVRPSLRRRAAESWGVTEKGRPGGGAERVPGSRHRTASEARHADPPTLEVARMTAALVDIFCRSFPAPPAAITLDIDDICDRVHGNQQLSLFHAHYDTRWFLPVHVYHVESGRPVAVLLRPARRPPAPRSAP